MRAGRHARHGNGPIGLVLGAALGILALAGCNAAVTGQAAATPTVAPANSTTATASSAVGVTSTAASTPTPSSTTLATTVTATPAATAIPSTLTALPPTATVPAPTATATPLPPSPTPARTATPTRIPATATPALPAVQPGIQAVASGGLVPTTLQVPAAYRTGVFAPTRTVNLPPGWHIAVFAAGLDQPRGLAFSPQGVLYASLQFVGRVVALPDPQHTGAAERVVTAASGLLNPFGLAFHDGALYLGETTRIDRFSVDPSSGVLGNRQVLVSGLPADGRHVTRTVQFGPDGALYVSIGSSCDVCVESDPRRATIMRFAADGSGGAIYARGMRNAVGFAFQPGTGLLWATINGQDGLGDTVPGEAVTVVQRGDNFGWPYCYGDRQPDPALPPPSNTYCASTTTPTLQLPAHMAPLGATFATGSVLPSGFTGSLLVSLHGSQHASYYSGYKLVRVAMRGATPAGVSDFATGWLTSAGYWGRPVDIVQGPDGAFYVSDDLADAIYRIWYTG